MCSVTVASFVARGERHYIVAHSQDERFSSERHWEAIIRQHTSLIPDLGTPTDFKYFFMNLDTGTTYCGEFWTPGVLDHLDLLLNRLTHRARGDTHLILCPDVFRIAPLAGEFFFLMLLRIRKQGQSYTANPTCELSRGNSLLPVEWVVTCH